MIRPLLLFVFSISCASSEGAHRSCAPDALGLIALPSDTTGQQNLIWLDGGFGVTGLGPAYCGAANFRHRSVIVSLGVFGSSNKDTGISAKLFDEWATLQTYDVLVSYVLTPSTRRTMLSIGTGVGTARYQERMLTGTGSFFGSTQVNYEVSDRKTVDIPLHFTAQFFSNSPAGLFIALQGHITGERSVAGILVGLRLMQAAP